MTLRTWHLEGAAVAAVLAGTVLVTGGGWTAWLGALAVQLTFHHAAIADRMAERQGLLHTLPGEGIADAWRWKVACYRWSVRLFAGKELCWFLYFAATRSWPALAGVVLFLIYPAWRWLWRSRHPLHRPGQWP